MSDRSAAHADETGEPVSSVGSRQTLFRACSRRQMLVLAGGALAAAGAAGGGVLLLSTGKAKEVEIGFGGALVYEPLPDVIADLRAEKGLPRHVKLGIVVELPEDLRPRLAARRAAIIDRLNGYLRDQPAAALMGEAGASRVRSALRAIINGEIAPGEVKSVLFREFIVS